MVGGCYTHSIDRRVIVKISQINIRLREIQLFLLHTTQLFGKNVFVDVTNSHDFDVVQLRKSLDVPISHPTYADDANAYPLIGTQYFCIAGCR